MKIAIIILLCAAVPVAQASWPGYLNTTLSVTLSGSSPRQLAHKRALWGSPTYAGAELDGTLVYPETRQQQLGCVPGGPRLPPDTILMLDTSGCGNTMKALNAQARGAVGVLLVENDGLCTDPELPCAGACGSGPTCTPPSGCLCELPELNDDGEGSSINIPVMLVSLHDGGPIKRCMMGFGGAGCPSGTTVTASFQWYEPNPSPLGTTLSVSGPGISGFFDHKVSNWGSPKISGTVVQGTLYEDSSPNARLSCAPGGSMLPDNTILVVTVANCEYTKKAINAQNRGAIGVLLVNDKGLCSDPGPPCGGQCGDDQICHPPSGCQCALPFMHDAGQGPLVDIPVMIISKLDGTPIQRCLRHEDGCTAADTLTARMTWTQPTPNRRDVVDWVLWSSSFDDVSNDLYVPLATISLRLRDRVSFRPRYFVYDGEVLGCTAPSQPCGDQCTNGGRYCAPNPTSTNNLGKDVVEENLRDICIWQSVSGTPHEYGWWNYTSLMTKYCANAPRNVWQACYQRFAPLAGIDTEAVDTCMSDSGGLEGDENVLLAEEIADRGAANVFVLPTIEVNEEIKTGVTDSAQSVLGAICDGYIVGSGLPSVCKCADVPAEQFHACIG